MLRPALETRAFAKGHLLYEVEMVAGLVWRLKRQQALLTFSSFDDRDPLARELSDLAGRNADIEAFGLHVRLLHDFLYDRRQSANDAIAADYFDDPMDWKRARRKLPHVLRSINDRVGTEMAHLSYDRPSPSKPWPYERIWKALSGVLRDFIDHAEPARAGEDSLARIRAILDVPLHEPIAVVPVVSSDQRSWTMSTPVVPGGGTDTGGGTATSSEIFPVDLPK